MLMFRNDFRELSRVHIKEARLLLKSREYSGAYYLTGLAVECALKACIARRTQRHEFPDKKRAINSFQHDLQQLVNVAGLKASLDVKMANVAFAANWSIVTDWHNESRYEIIGKPEASAIYSAVTAKQQGVMRWIRQHW